MGETAAGSESRVSSPWRIVGRLLTTAHDPLRSDNSVELEKAGARVARKATADVPVADEFQEQLTARPALKAAFQALTPGRRSGYLLYFASAKQAKTREARIEKCLPLILAGKGLDD
jgi:uncharacterized protein YdeI (YjbR/CyaY-like superfamily)